VDATLFHGYTDKDKAQLELDLFVLDPDLPHSLSLGLLLIRGDSCALLGAMH